MLKVTLPPWHDDAIKLLKKKMHIDTIVETLVASGFDDVTPERIQRVVDPRWLRVNQKEEPVTDRIFEKVSSPDPSDNKHRVRIRCGYKGCQETMIFSKAGIISPVQAARWFRDKGWGVGGSPKQDLCPKHTASRGQVTGESKETARDTMREALKKKKQPEVTPTAKSNAIMEAIDAALPPMPPMPIPEAQQNDTLSNVSNELAPQLAMTRLDRRIIIAKLTDVYVDERVGYKAGWSDEVVAHDLGTRVSWVASIREENFGPDTDETETKMVADIHNQIGHLQALIEEIRLANADIDQKIKEVDERLDLFDKAKAEFDLAVIEFNRRRSNSGTQ